MRLEHPSSGDEVPTSSGIIEVRIRELDQLFESMDPSPFHDKALDHDAEEYIVGRARELGSGVPTALLIYLDQPVGLPDEGRVLGNAIRAHFARRSDQSRRQLRELLRRGWISLIIGLAFLAASVVAGQSVARVMGGGPLPTVLRESLVIGGWVAMWGPMEIFLYDWWRVRGERLRYDQLSRVAVRIIYARAGPPTATGSPDTPAAHARHAQDRPFTGPD